MRGSITRKLGLLVAALALPVLAIGTADAATGAATKPAKLGSGHPQRFGLVTAARLRPGRHRRLQEDQQADHDQLRQQGLGHRSPGAGRPGDRLRRFGRPYPAADQSKIKGGPVLYFPTVADPITVAYNLPGVKLNLSGDTVAKIFQGQITTWNDPAIKAENPKAKLPSTAITVAVRSDSSGTTQNFTTWLTKAAPCTYTLGASSKPTWPTTNQQGAQNTGVAKIVQDTEGAIGYVDYSDAQALQMTYANIKNADGKYVAPSTAAAVLAVREGHDQPGPDVRPDQRRRPEGLPDHVAHLHHRVPEPDGRGEGQRDQGVPHLHLRPRPGDGSDDRLRPDLEGAAHPGQGPAQQDRHPGQLTGPDGLVDPAGAGRLPLDRSAPAPTFTARSFGVASGKPYGSRSATPT